MTVIAYFIGLLVVALVVIVVVGPVLINLILERPSGVLREWHQTMTTFSADTSVPSSGEQWDAAIAVLDHAGATFIREWRSMYSRGEGVYREYRLDDTDILIEVDRVNGFTISGKRSVAEPLAHQIELEVELIR